MILSSLALFWGAHGLVSEISSETGQKGFRLAQSQGRTWFLDSQDRPFWSMGVCCTGPGDSWDDSNPNNPAYTGYRLFPNSKAWVEDTLNKLAANGFNSIGGWSDTRLFQKFGDKKRLPYFEVLHLGAYDKAPWRDMFTKEFGQIIDKAAKDQVEKVKSDPYLVGYFSDNELGWWREALFATYLAFDKKSPGKVRLIDFLKKRYGSSLTAFQKDWISDVKSFEEIDGKIKLRSGGKGMEVVRDWQSYLTDAYYRMMQATIKRHDPNRLILGDRYCQFYYPNVVQTATKYVDAISTNYGADWNNGENTEYFLSALHQITKKPVLITEFYMAAMENRSGNKNSSGGFPVVQTQAERAAAIQTYLTDIGRRPYVVGAHWFQFHDEPMHGRGDGENYNMGLVDIHGKDYEELLKVFREFKPGKTWVPEYKSHLPLMTATAAKDLKAWPKAQALIKPGGEAPFADLYIGWDGQYAYIGLASMGFTDESLYPDKKVPEEDRSQLSFEIDGKKRWVRFSGSKRDCTHDPDTTVVAWRDGVRSELVIRVPKPASDTFSFKATLTTHGRADRMTWSDSRSFTNTK